MASIGDVHGIDPKAATKLRKAGVRTTEGLLRRCATRSGRTKLAAATGLSTEDLATWVNRADLMRIKGIGSEYAELLEAAGAGTVKELRRRNPRALTTRIVALNDQRRLVRRLPTEGMVGAWIEHARSLDGGTPT